MGEDPNYHAYDRRVKDVLDPPSPVSSHTRSHDQQHQVTNNTDPFQPRSNPSTHDPFRVENPSVYLGEPFHLDCPNPSHTSTSSQLNGSSPVPHTPSMQEYQNIEDRSRASIERDLRSCLTGLGYTQVEIQSAVNNLDNKDAVWDFEEQSRGCDSQTPQRPPEPFPASASSGEQYSMDWDLTVSAASLSTPLKRDPSHTPTGRHSEPSLVYGRGSGPLSPHPSNHYADDHTLN